MIRGLNKEEYISNLLTCKEEYQKLTREQKGKIRSALQSALDIRKFEIEMYWKRATYFWTFISVIYGSYFLMLNEFNKSFVTEFIKILKPNESQLDISKLPDHLNNAIAVFNGLEHVQYMRLILFSISAVGFIFCLGWVSVNRGSKFWQNNWERHVDLLEDYVHGPLYKTIVFEKPSRFSIKGEYPYSVSKINQLVSVFVLMISSTIFIREFIILYSIKELKGYGLLGVIITALFCLYMVSATRSKLGMDFAFQFYNTTSQSSITIYAKLLYDGIKYIFHSFVKYFVKGKIFKLTTWTHFWRIFFDLYPPSKNDNSRFVKRLD